jgi:hypothetical protein
LFTQNVNSCSLASEYCVIQRDVELSVCVNQHKTRILTIYGRILRYFHYLRYVS